MADAEKHVAPRSRRWTVVLLANLVGALLCVCRCTLLPCSIRRMGYGVAVVYVFVTAAHSGILGALIALSPNVIDPIYQHTSA